jgi:2,4-dienoyl-CoA reductase-like NADH-dependent reductase (Old Yellow Enzyme family)
MEIVAAIQSVWPPTLPIWVRISASDWVDGGWSIEDSIRLCRILKETGVDTVDVSSGGAVPYARIQAGPGYQVPFAEAIKSSTGMLTAAVGIIVSARQAEDILQQQQADLIMMARELLRDPYFPLHAAKELGDDVAWPAQYERAKR